MQSNRHIGKINLKIDNKNNMRVSVIHRINRYLVEE